VSDELNAGGRATGRIEQEAATNQASEGHHRSEKNYHHPRETNVRLRHTCGGRPDRSPSQADRLRERERERERESASPKTGGQADADNCLPPPPCPCAILPRTVIFNADKEARSGENVRTDSF